MGQAGTCQGIAALTGCLYPTKQLPHQAAVQIMHLIRLVLSVGHHLLELQP